jgi:hypothetical protein
VLVVMRAAKVEPEVIEWAVCNVVLAHAPGLWRPALSEGEADDERAMPFPPQLQLPGGFFVLIPTGEQSIPPAAPSSACRRSHTGEDSTPPTAPSPTPRRPHTFSCLSDCWCCARNLSCAPASWRNGAAAAACRDLLPA